MGALMASNPPVWADLPGNLDLLTVVDCWVRPAFSDTQRQLRIRLNRDWSAVGDGVIARWYDAYPAAVLVRGSVKAGVEIQRPQWTTVGLKSSWSMTRTGVYCGFKATTTSAWPPYPFVLFTARRPPGSGNRLVISPIFEAERIPLFDALCR